MGKIYYGVKANFKDGSFCGVFFNDKGDRHDAIQDDLSSGDSLAVDFVEMYGDHEDKEEINLVDASDPRLSSDPLTALAAVMDHHLMEFEHEGLSVLSNAIQIFYSECGPTDSDDIK